MSPERDDDRRTCKRITDAISAVSFIATYAAFWFTIFRVTVVSPTVESDLATFSPARLINLPTLKNAGMLVASTTIPAGATAVRIYIGRQAQLQQLNGSRVDVALLAPEG